MTLKILIILLYFSITAAGVYSQTDTSEDKTTFSYDSVKNGKYYYFYLNDGSVVFGKVISADKNNIVVNHEDETITFETISVVKISGKYSSYEPSTMPGNINSILTVGTGLAMPTNLHGSIHYKPGPALFCNYAVLFGRHFGFRADLDYTYISREPDMTYGLTGGAYNDFSLRANFLLGDYNYSQVNYYIFAGGGVGVYRKGPVSYFVNESPRTDAALNNFDAVFEFGVAVSIPVSKKLRIHTEGQLNYWADYSPDYFIIKAGVSF